MAPWYSRNDQSMSKYSLLGCSPTHFWMIGIEWYCHLAGTKYKPSPAATSTTYRYCTPKTICTPELLVIDGQAYYGCVV